MRCPQEKSNEKKWHRSLHAKRVAGLPRITVQEEAQWVHQEFPLL